jgi:hypothetical protein
LQKIIFPMRGFVSIPSYPSSLYPTQNAQRE